MLDHQDSDMLYELGDEYEGNVTRHLSRQGVNGNEASTFFALSYLFEAAARRRMPTSRTQDGRLPTEIYAKILRQVTDPETRHKCMDVSRTFRNLCQEDIFLADGVQLTLARPEDAATKANEGSDLFLTNFGGGVHCLPQQPAFHTNSNLYNVETSDLFQMFDPASGAASKVVKLGCSGERTRRESSAWGVCIMKEDPMRWKVLIGNEFDRKSLLGGIEFGDREV